MPLTHISLRAGKPEAYRRAIFDSLARAMQETFNVPRDNQFMTITEHSAQNFRFDPSYMGISRTDDLVFIQIAANDTRTVDQKKEMFRRIALYLSESPGLRPEDVFVNLIEVKKENWSLGNGVAQYA
ncbi:phenylpyruvate tautomerase PptA (4-oxalocrotonate tautomerase family) [Xanthobacter flavus]|uniref:Phenylpyruvate tautomerase PptA (4-oxalocrotonate tautomerase family) n=1 Tax=Xanthobacter flavus TaxID=281 RepID=A0A9W6FLN2_XANFL|nr:tautomerase family protein [Xanthobacter flavus]MDR6336585.1 phenylpyruvate tautomerase PptA (4-oxalocrotonate tautomerase family) [Xanthobacter flavus]GLI24556.1 tautomerase family protein [Xanthobacter flavus]